MVWSENSIHPDLNLNENQEITNYPIFPKWYSLAYMSGKMRKHKKDQKGPEARLLQERCVHCHQLFSQVNNSIEREIFEMRRLHLVWQSSRIVPVCSRCAEARYRVHVLSCLCQVSSLPLSLRGWKLYRWEPPAQWPPTDPGSISDDDICTCDNTDGHLGKRWLGLSLLAVLVPCLCLYPLLTACHACGRACKMCGGRHQS